MKGCGSVFVVLCPVRPEKGFLKRRKQSKNLARAPAVLCREFSAFPFCKVEFTEEKNGINWDEIEEKCGRYSSRIVAPKSVHLPDGRGLKRYVPTAFLPHLIFNTAKKIISEAAVPTDIFCITVTDRNGLCSSKIHSLLPLCSVVRVVTSKPEKYADACEKALDLYGATLIIRPDYEPTHKPDTVICCDGAVSASMSDSAVFTNRKRTCGKIRFCGSGITLTEKHRDFLPESIDPLDFAGALTEFCGCRDYADAGFSDIDISCGKCASPSPEKCLLCHITDTHS